MPPVADRATLYAAPASAAGKDGVVIATGDMADGPVMLIYDDALEPGSSASRDLVAVTTTTVFVVTFGAVKSPVLEIVPALTDQVTAVSDVPVDVAMNCKCCDDPTVALVGESERVLAGL